MKPQKLITGTTCLLLIALSPPSWAGADIGIYLGVAPVYTPSPVVYAPPPVVYRSPPVIYQAPPVIVAPSWTDDDRWDHGWHHRYYHDYYGDW
ncbi:hypothetical protein ACFQ3P_25745 [Paraburkholderia sabiae]|uniref:Uncharacterized protein n=1 Tax=Paraburkholderia sabiae TaxID=273251 RepID=A0ABU9QLW9_9BURK|nr:hypothetical protein [Paraburkholderia sabiae]WJZ77317.1 hypothetical protein QEN71_35180 [Paraburkholderia sabiae]CAD6547914.1 hypothetical protein LMG24235_04503 [Paraburkholderia sabiae]